MSTHIHMQDQVHNRIEVLMNENNPYDWDELFQNAATVSLIIVFISLGLNW